MKHIIENINNLFSKLINKIDNMHPFLYWVEIMILIYLIHKLVMGLGANDTIHGLVLFFSGTLLVISWSKTVLNHE